jgi:hypothetical protein
MTVATLEPNAKASALDAGAVLREIEVNGIALLPGLIDAETLAGMQRAFAARLKHLRWNNVDGYAMTERYRHMVEDVLTLHQGFVDLALHPLVKEVTRAYVGENVELTEAKGWLSTSTKRDFHGWHGDAWYDQSKATGIPRELKLAFYLTDVNSGEFAYIRGSHGKQHPRSFARQEAEQFPQEKVSRVLGSAGTAVLFDTSGIHRQMAPILEPRQALFYNYHEPNVPLQKEDVDYYRYHPLLLNAAFLGGLTAGDMKLLGFGNKTNYLEGYVRPSRAPLFHSMVSGLWRFRVWSGEWFGRIGGRIRRLFTRR